jgi:hypothetical protein
MFTTASSLRERVANSSAGAALIVTLCFAAAPARATVVASVCASAPTCTQQELAADGPIGVESLLSPADWNPADIVLNPVGSGGREVEIPSPAAAGQRSIAAAGTEVAAQREAIGFAVSSVTALLDATLFPLPSVGADAGIIDVFGRVPAPASGNPDLRAAGAPTRAASRRPVPGSRGQLPLRDASHRR